MITIKLQNKLIELQENLIGFAYSLTADKDKANDLVQETCLKALKNSNKFEPNSNIKAWTFTILKNTFINNCRHVNRYATCNNITPERFCIKYTHEWGAYDPESAYTSKELEQSIEALDEAYKLPLKMHHEGFKYKEIAESLDLKIGTVKSRIFFARKKLISQLEEYAT